MCGSDQHCSETDWTLQLVKKNTCSSCEYRCLLTVSPVSMKYNGGTFFSRLSYSDNNAILTITNVTVVSEEQKSHLNYYIIGSGGVGIIVIMLLAIGVIYKIKKHCRRKTSSYHQLVRAVTVEQSPSPSRKQIILCSCSVTICT